jgi:hypothetical protein
LNLPHSHFLGWEVDDREALREHQVWQSESCSECGVHPSYWDPRLGGHRNRVVATWKFCRVCELIEQAKAAGPPSKAGGWHLTLKFNETV